MDIATMMDEIGARARKASAAMTALPTAVKNRTLNRMAEHIDSSRDELKEANARDIEAGKKAGLSTALLDRLLLNDKRIKGMIDSLRTVASLEDPAGEIFDMRTRPSGIRVGKMRVPIGVIGIIYESRPNVTSDAAGLCIKSGNAVILRGGKEAIHSNKKIVELLQNAGRDAGLPDNAVQLIPVTEREAVSRMLTMNQYIDLIIPRGGRGLIETVVKNATIPVIKHYDGNCYIYVDKDVDQDEAVDIVVNAKTQRPGVCNALESLLVHRDVAESFLGKMIPALQEKQVQVRADATVRKQFPDFEAAEEEDWRTEYLDLIVTVGTVPGIDEAIRWINRYGSHHTDTILTTDYERALQFLNEVDSACVFVNCSTRFSDGGEFGMGCEIGISTDKLHARGPMGVRELTTAKFVAFGTGQIRE